LSQVYGFIRQSRRHIKIYSEVGAGTTMKVYLPRLIGRSEQATVSMVRPAPKGDANEVILVEDDPLI
jgi:hypothetical protein